jgi:hypothetical protein
MKDLEVSRSLEPEMKLCCLINPVTCGECHLWTMDSCIDHFVEKGQGVWYPVVPGGRWDKKPTPGWHIREQRPICIGCYDGPE